MKENAEIALLLQLKNETNKACTKYSSTQYYYNNSCSDLKDGFYIKDPDNRVFEKCYLTCKTCTQKGNYTNNNCDTCQNNDYL